MIDPIARLGSEEERGLFRDTVRAMLARGDHAEAERLVMGYARASETLIGALCAALRPEQVSLSGWDEVHSTIDYFARDGFAITAIGVDLTDNAEGDTDARGCTEPGAETSYYTEDCFAFAGKSRAELAACAAAGPGWQGNFESIDNALVVHGLASLHSALRDAEKGLLAASPGDRLVGWATLVLRFQQAVFAGAEAAGLPAGLVVLAGENEFASDSIGANGVHIVGTGAAAEPAPLPLHEPAAPPVIERAADPVPPAPAPEALTAWPPVAVRRSPLGFGRKGL